MDIHFPKVGLAGIQEYFHTPIDQKIWLGYGFLNLATDHGILCLLQLQQELSPIKFPVRRFFARRLKWFALSATVVGCAVKEALHELGHTFGLRHCPDTACLMHYCRSEADVDRKSSDLCRYCRILLDDELRKPASE